MSEVKPLLDALLWDIYGTQKQNNPRKRFCTNRYCKFNRRRSKGVISAMTERIFNLTGNRKTLERLSIRKLIDICAILKVEILLMGYFLERVLIVRDRLRRQQDILCEFVTAVLYVEQHDAHPQMRFSLSPPPPKALVLTSPSSTSTNTKVNAKTNTTNSNSSSTTTVISSHYNKSSNNNSSIIWFPSRSKTNSHNMLGRNLGSGNASGDEATSPLAMAAADDDVASDYNQWLHAMKMVARLPGGTPPEFRRKLWLSLADKYLKSKNIDWDKQQEKCFCEEWREDDEELGIQIVKDLHRTGSNLCTGPAGSINQAKLKRILLGYARYNPEVGYCQGFNMLGALILQVMDKEEIESMKVMIYLVEGVLPTGYFYGSMGGLQADMGVFRELMQTKLPRLAKHLQKLQGPIENAYEPPLTNVFTMQWFLTMFCTCLPMSCVLRVWDLVLIEGSDVLLRTALVLWGLLEDRVLSTRTADDFYGKMGSFSSELLNGHLIDSNGLIERVVQLGPIPDIQKLRDKHLYNIAPLRHKQGIQLYYDEEDMQSDEESRLAVATVWGIPWGRRGSSTSALSHSTPGASKTNTENKDRLALDISLLKKQYDRLRERQKQAHVILTTACTTTARQGGPSTTQATQGAQMPVNQLLMGRPAIVTNKGKRIGPPAGAIPPARKPSLPAVLQVKPAEKQLRRGETLHWRDTELSKRRRDSLTWKEIKADRANQRDDGDTSSMKSQKLRTRLGKSDSSSYSEESECGDGSSTDTSLCDEDDLNVDKSLEQSPKRKSKTNRKLKDLPKKELLHSRNSSMERTRPKSWAPTTHEIPFVLMTGESPVHSGDEKQNLELPAYEEVQKEEEDSATESDRVNCRSKKTNWSESNYSAIAGDLASIKLTPLHIETSNVLSAVPVHITSISQLSPMPDITTYLNSSSISPLPTPKPLFVDSISSLGSGSGDGDGNGEHGNSKKFDVSDDGVTNQYFERVNSVERPTKLDLFYSLNEEENDRVSLREIAAIEGDNRGTSQLIKQSAVNSDLKENLRDKEDIKQTPVCSNKFKLRELSLTKAHAAKVPQIRDDNIPGENKNDYKEVLSMTIDKKMAKPIMISKASRKRADPRRKTLTRSSTIELEERFQALERRLSQDILSKEQTNAKSIAENPKQIPSTADLEARYNTLEKQLSADKQRIENNQHPQGVHTFSNEPNSEPNKECIPSIALSMETRFNSLTKQISSNSSDEKKESIDLKNEKIVESSKMKSASEETSKLHETNDTNSDTKPSTSKNEVKDLERKESTSESKPFLKKLPSTAELEDRFNALERKMSIQKSSPAKSKKEPPDEPETTQEQNDKRMTTNSRSCVGSADKSEVSKPQKCEVIEEKKQQKQINEKNKPQVDEAFEDEIRTNHEKNSKITDRKLPPSTEELEKRFEALEKKLSITSIEVFDPQNISSAVDKTNNEKERKNDSDSASIKQNSDEIRNRLADNAQKYLEKVPSEEKSTNCKKHDPEQAKCATANKKMLPEKAEEQEHSEELQWKGVSKRRASEPPSTEDLEKRYESLKRRMSTRTFGKDMQEKSETVDEAMHRIEQEVIAEICENTEETGNTTRANKSNEKKQPPTTEDLESRYEALHRNDVKNSEIKELKEVAEHKVPKTPFNTPKSASPNDKSLTESEQNLPKTPVNTPQSDSPIEKSMQHTKVIKETDHKITKNAVNTPKEASPTSVEIKRHVDVAIEAHIPEPPAMPEIVINKSHVADVQHPPRHQQRALIEELQSKIKGQPGDENLKPSEINPQRKRIAQRPTPMGDETSEAPANTAYYRSGNYEPWQSKRMVRRFSDLPSRADLENRLQFLEKQLYKKFYKQRCASDSEVASKGLSIIGLDERPSTSKQATDLEQRVLILEKQLSENSLKLLEAMRSNTVITHSGSDEESPRRQSTETINATGKELVRYTHFGEIDESDTHKPINISINIKMLLNKDIEAKKSKVDNLPSTDELQARLETLEQQLNEERAKNQIKTENEIMQMEELLDEIIIDNIADEKETELSRPEVNDKVEKDTLNQVLKCDIQDKASSDDSESQKNATTTRNKAEPEAAKEVKTLENEERVRSAEEPKVKEDTEPESNVLSIVEPIINQTEKQTEVPDTMILNASDVSSVDPNNRTLVLLMDNEPKEVKVRRLTRANTEELEDLFQALEKQLSDRNLIKSADGKLIHAENNIAVEAVQQETDEAKAITNLSKEIQAFGSGMETQNKQDPNEKSQKKPVAQEEKKQAVVEDQFDWGPDPVKRHLKRKTVHLPSTKELESRFRSLERQIKLLEEVEKIDVEQRLNEIERKIKLQYSLSHEEDLNKFLELCEGKGLDDEEIQLAHTPVEIPVKQIPERCRSPGRNQTKSPSRDSNVKTSHTSPARPKASQNQRSPYTSPARKQKPNQSPYTSPARRLQNPDTIPVAEDLEYRYRVLDLVRSKSKENLVRRKIDPNKPPIHPLEMLLDPSPDENDIPTTGELEHRIRMLDEKLKSPSHKPRLHSPTIEDIKRKKLLEEQRPKTPVHNLETLVSSPTKPEPPTTDMLEARMRALEEEQSFDFKTQKNFKEFNQKLKDVVSPSLSFEEFKAAKSREQSPRRNEKATTPKSAFRDSDTESRRDEATASGGYYRPTSPKVIRFRDEQEEYYNEDERSISRTERMVGKENGILDIIAENTKILERILKKTLADRSSSNSNINRSGTTVTTSSEGLDTLGPRLMRETSPLRRTGTHTGVPLRTGENINDRLTSIKNTIKSIDTLCEEKPYQKEKCQRYIDSLFSDSIHFGSKKSSLEDLHSQSRSQSRGRGRTDHTPAIRITSSEYGQRSSEYRSLGSAESIRTTSPLRAASPLHHRSNRDLRREISPRRRRNEELEEYESSRVRRDNMLLNNFHDNRSDLSSFSSLTKFHKVDRQLEPYTKYDERERSLSRSASRSPLRSPYESKDSMMNTSLLNTTTTHSNSYRPSSTANTRLDIERPVSPYRQPTHNLLGYDSLKQRTNNTPVYAPAKLEIRHTTVTSTFYDRLLTEKQIEKSLTRPPSRSPVISPSVTSKSYTDLSHSSLSTGTPAATSYAPIPTTSGVPGTSIQSAMHTLTSSYTAGTSLPSQPYTASTHAMPINHLLAAPISTSSASSIELRIRSCENILAQLSTTANTSTVPTVSTTVLTGPPRSALGLPGLISVIPTTSTNTTLSPYKSSVNLNATTNSYIMPYTNLVNPSAATVATAATAPITSTGVYNPVMPFTLRQTLDTGAETGMTMGATNLESRKTESSTFNQYNSNFSSNN